MSIRFIKDKPAILISDRKHGKILAIADIHLGIESELYKKGVVISPQSKKLQDDILSLVKMTKAKKLVIIGDLKHKIPGISFRELKEIPKFINPISRKVEIILVKGNHDTELEGMLPKKVKVYGSKGFRIGPYGFFHGHAWPDKELLECDNLFTAHIHPTVEFVDDFGFRIVEKVWVMGKLKKKTIKERYKTTPSGDLNTLIFPSFNPIITGVPLNSKRTKYMGPLLSSGAFDVKKSEAYMLNGTLLGKTTKVNS